MSVESAEGTSTVLVSDLGDRVRPTTYPSNTGLAVSHGGGVVGWIGLDHYDSSTGDYRATPVLRFADGSEEHFAPVSSSAVLVGIVGAGCDSHPARCRLVTSVRGRTFLLGHGGRRLLAPASAVDVRADLTTISLRSRRGTCSAVWSARGAPRWRDCRRNFHSFSPAGDHVLAADGFGAYLGASRVDVLDDRDRVEASFRAPRGVTVTQATWEDDRHVLVLLTRDWTTAYLVRLSVGGRASLVFRSRGRIRSLVSYELPLR